MNYKDGNTWFTKSKTGNTKYALVCLDENTATPSTLQWKANVPVKGTKMILLQTGEKVQWTKEGEGIKVVLPKSIVNNKTTYPALAFSFQSNE